MKKRRQISNQARKRKALEQDARRIHELKCDEARSKGVVANTETILAQIEKKYAAGDISITEYNWGLAALGIDEVE